MVGKAGSFLYIEYRKSINSETRFMKKKVNATCDREDVRMPKNRREEEKGEEIKSTKTGSIRGAAWEVKTKNNKKTRK